MRSLFTCFTRNFFSSQRCVDFAFQAKDFNLAGCLVYVVDRATYWAGASRALIQVAKLIKQADPLVAIAPQVQVREARVLKDEGDLHGAMKVLNEILERRQDQPGNKNRSGNRNRTGNRSSFTVCL